MHVPPGMTQAQVIAAVDKAIDALAPSFTFGIYGLDDIRQEGWKEAIKCLPRYESGGFHADGTPCRPLENFAYRHIKFRLINLKRNKLRRSDAPCSICHQSPGKRSDHPDGRFCAKYLAWKARNDRKASLQQTADADSAPESQTAAVAEESAQLGEALGLIDRHLPVEMRATYLQMRAGVSVPADRRREVEEEVRDILGGMLDG